MGGGVKDESGEESKTVKCKGRKGDGERGASEIKTEEKTGLRRL